MYDFNSITAEQEKQAVSKFKEYGKGVTMGKYTSETTYKWEDLIDANLFSDSTIKQKMLEVARTINTNCNDEFLGDLSTAFKTRDNKNKEIKFSHVEVYSFLRGVLRYRRETEEYKAKTKKLSDLKKFVEDNKSTEDKLKEANQELAILEKELE